MNIEEIKKLINLLKKSELKKLHVREGEFEVCIEDKDTKVEHIRSHEPKAVSKKETTTSASVVENGKYITSPMVGTFYATPAPDQPAFVKVGDVVEEDTVVCIIEAMKVMNEVKAGVKGTIKKLLVSNAQPVEFGTKLYSIE